MRAFIGRSSMMEIVMKTLIIFMSAIAVLFPISSSSAQSQGHDITVQGAPLTPARWVAGVSSKLDKIMTYPVMFSNEMPASGIVSVRFRADAANRPTALTVTRKSGDRRLDQAALRAISRLGPLPAMPASFRPNQLFVANLVYAANYDAYFEQLAMLRKEAKATQTASSTDPNIVALVVTSHTGAGS